MKQDFFCLVRRHPTAASADSLLLALALAGLGLLALLASSAVAGGGAAPFLSLLAPPEVVLLILRDRQLRLVRVELRARAAQ